MTDRNPSLPAWALGKIAVDPDSGCWTWLGAVNSVGYGWLREGRTSILAHRGMYEAMVGPIPDGLVIDHMCRVPLCVNPEHLDPVTPSENVRRGLAYRVATTFPPGSLALGRNGAAVLVAAARMQQRGDILTFRDIGAVAGVDAMVARHWLGRLRQAEVASWKPRTPSSLGVAVREVRTPATPTDAFPRVTAAMAERPPRLPKTPAPLPSACGKGHPFDAANTYTLNGRRSCRTCNRLAQARRRAKVVQP